jgi:O-methyltransferase
MDNLTPEARHSFKGRPIISAQVGISELGIVWRELEKVLAAGVPGDVVEFGCYIGTTSLFIRRLLDERGESGKRAFHVYDSFEGLPEKGKQDESPAGADFRAGQLSVSKKNFLREFHAANLQPPIVHKGWFKDLADKDVPGHIAFAFLDGDFYDSIMDSLKLVWPRLAKGGVVLIDDYGREALPGAQRAVQDFFAGQVITVSYEHDIAIIKA